MENGLYEIYDIDIIEKFTIQLLAKGKAMTTNYLYCDILNKPKTIKNKNDPYVIIMPSFHFDCIGKESADTIGSFKNVYTEIEYGLINDSNELKIDLPELKVDMEELEEFSMSHCISVDSSIVYSTVEKGFFVYEFNKEAYFKSIEKKVPGLINLLKRGIPKELIFKSIKELIYNKMSLEKLYKFFERLSNILHTFQVKGPIKTIEYNPHKVQRITGVHTFSEHSLYIPKNNKPSIYFSKSNQLSSLDVY